MGPIQQLDAKAKLIMIQVRPMRPGLPTFLEQIGLSIGADQWESGLGHPPGFVPVISLLILLRKKCESMMLFDRKMLLKESGFGDSKECMRE